MTRDDTNDDTNDDALDPALLEAARAYHAPPTEVPREAMWSAIEAVRAGTARPDTPGLVGDTASRGARRRPRPWRTAWPVAIAAAATIVLAAGIAIGRWSGLALDQTRSVAAVPTSLTSTPAARPAVTPDGVAYQVAVARDLTQAEALLTASRGERQLSPHHRADTQLASWARDVLSTTRLLLDSPATTDPQRRRLLEDLELVLVQMVELAPDQSGSERQMIDSTLEHDHVLSRLRYAVPAGATGI